MKHLNSIIIALLLGVVVLTPVFVSAQSEIGQNFPPSSAGGNNPPSAVGNNAVFTLENPLGIKNFCDLVKKLLNIVLAIGVPIAVLFLVWAGFRFILARGSQQGLQDAKKNFMYVIIGIAIFLGAWTLASIISATVKTLDESNTIQFCGR